MRTNVRATETQTISINKPYVIKVIIISAVVFLFATTRIMGMLGGIGFATATGLPYKLGPLGFISILISYIMSGFDSTNLYILGATFVMLCIKYACVKLRVRIQQPFILSTLTFISLFSISVISFFMNNEPLTTLIINTAQAVFAMTFTYYSFMFYKSFLSERPVERYSKFESYSLIIVTTVLISSLSAYAVYNINLGYLIGGVIVIAFMVKKGAVGGGISAILVGIGSVLYSIEHLEYAGVLIVAGFIGGVFFEWGKLPTLSAFTVIYTICIIVFIAPTDLMAGSLTILISVLIYIFIPDSYIDKATAIALTSAPRIKNNSVFKGNISSRLNFASATIIDLQKSLNFIGNKLKSQHTNNIDVVVQNVQNDICAKCYNRLKCFGDMYSDTTEGFSVMLDILKRENAVDSSIVPDYFADNCKKINDVVLSFNKSYQQYQKNQIKSSSCYNSRLIVSEQFECISDLLTEISDELQQSKSLDEATSAAVSIALINNDISANQVSCFTEEDGRFYCDIYTFSNVEIDLAQLAEVVCGVVQKDIDTPNEVVVGPYKKISLCEVSPITLEIGVKQFNYKDNTVCGDNFVHFTDNKGDVYLMLSDGMGKGRRAALDSNMTCSITQELIKAGFGYESALKILNSALTVKSTEESSATIDIAKIKTHSNSVEFIKAGAATSYVKTNGVVKKVQAFTLPIGLLAGIEYDKKVIDIDKGDIIVIVSDGVNPISDEWIDHILLVNAYKSAEEIAEIIAQTAKSKGVNEQDDITAIVCKVA